MNLLAKYFEYLWESEKVKRKSQIISLIENNPGSKLVDCGCSDGKYTKTYGKKANTSNLYGIEIDSSSSKVARAFLLNHRSSVKYHTKG